MMMGSWLAVKVGLPSRSFKVLKLGFTCDLLDVDRLHEKGDYAVFAKAFIQSTVHVKSLQRSCYSLFLHSILTAQRVTRL